MLDFPEWGFDVPPFLSGRFHGCRPTYEHIRDVQRYPHFSVWSALIHLILIWTPFQSPNFWSGVPDPCPQVTGQFWGIVHLEPLGVYTPSNFEENLLQDLGGDLLSCLSSGYSHVVYSSKCSPDPLLVMGWNQDLVSSLGSVNIPCIEILNKCLLWGIRITNFSILVWFWTFFFDWAKFGGHTPAPTPPLRDLRPWPDPSLQRAIWRILWDNSIKQYCCKHFQF